MKKSKFSKTKLASVLLLSTVLLPNIAYAEDDLKNEAESEVQQNVNDESSSFADETQAINDDNNTYIEMNTPSTNESINDEEDLLLIPADPEDDNAGDKEELLEPVDDSEINNGDITDETADLDEGTEGEEETPDGGATPENTDPEEPVVDEEEPETPTITEPIEPTEPTYPETPVNPELPIDPEEPYGPEQPEQEIPVEPEVPNNDGSEENVEETESSAEQETMGTGNGQKKIYRYNYGDILNGINFNYDNIENDMTTLDQRVTRVMSSQIIEEKDLTEEQKRELEEEANKTTPHGAEELPETGETSTNHYMVIGLMVLIGSTLLVLSKKMNTDN